jgi:uncharacterized membrane protein YidH (DUF202 family)
MEWFLYVFGILWLAAGACSILFPETIRLVFTKTAENTPHRILAIIAAIIGLLLLISSPHAGYPVFFIVLGGIALVKGILLWFNPLKLYEKSIRWYLHDTSDFFFNLLGIIMLIFGTAVMLLA